MPVPMSSGEAYSSGWWLSLSRHRMKSMVIEQIFETATQSCPAFGISDLEMRMDTKTADPVTKVGWVSNGL
jgi:hypothetical protein